MHHLAPIPRATSAFGDSKKFLGDAIRKSGFAPVCRRVEDPFDRGSAACVRFERYGNGQGCTTTHDSFELFDLEKRRHGVNDGREVLDRVEG